MSNRARIRAPRHTRPGRYRAQAVLAQLHSAELESALAWVLHDSTIGQQDQIVSRAISVTEAVRDLYRLDDNTCYVVLEMITAAIAADAMREDQGLSDAPDESLMAKLTEVNEALSRNKAGNKP